MPYRWTQPPSAPHDAPLARLDAWPNQSMTPPQFVAFIGGTATMLALPLLAVLGSPVVWVLLGFFLMALWGVWFAISRNRRDLRLREELVIWPDRIALRHLRPAGAPLEWEANPYWVSVHLHDGERPVENYLTLKGAGREVQLGTFLSPEEREALYDDLRARLGDLRPG